MKNRMNFKLRPWKTSDVDDLSRYANNENIALNLTNQFPYPYTEKHAISFIENVSLVVPTQVFAIDIDGVACGGIGLHSKDDIFIKNMELGYWLAEPFWGNGIITEAIKQMVEYGFKTFDITRIYATPFGRNVASQRVLEKVGFILEARLVETIFKNNEFEDELIYGIRQDSDF